MLSEIVVPAMLAIVGVCLFQIWLLTRGEGNADL